MSTRNTKAQKTKKKLTDAFMRLYNKKSYYSITVQEICNEASLNRSTFYLHFDSIDQMLRDIEDRLLAETEELTGVFSSFDFTKSSGSNLTEANLGYNRFISYLYDKKVYFLPFLSPDGDPYFLKKYKQMIRERYKTALKNSGMNLGKNQDIIIDFIAGGITATTYNFLKEDNISPEELMDIFVKFTSRIPLLKN